MMSNLILLLKQFMSGPKATAIGFILNFAINKIVAMIRAELDRKDRIVSVLKEKKDEIKRIIRRDD